LLHLGDTFFLLDQVLIGPAATARAHASTTKKTVVTSAATARVME